MTDVQYRELQKHAYSYALRIVKNEHDAQDIVQNSLLKMFVKEDSIENHKNYLLKCVKTNAINLINAQKRQINISDIDSITSDENNTIENRNSISEEKARLLLSASDFRTYKMYIKHKNIKDIAQVRKIPEGTVKRQVSMMKKNLEAAILKSEGVMSGPNILTFQQIENIKYFIKMISRNKKDLSKLKKYFEHTDCPDMDIAEVIDWSYRKLKSKNNQHRLALVYKDNEGKLHFPIFEFIIDKKNYIKIVEVTFGRVVKKMKVEDTPLKKCQGNGFLYPKGFNHRKNSLSIDVKDYYK